MSCTEAGRRNPVMYEEIKLSKAIAGASVSLIY